MGLRRTPRLGRSRGPRRPASLPRRPRRARASLQAGSAPSAGRRMTSTVRSSASFVALAWVLTAAKMPPPISAAGRPARAAIARSSPASSNGWPSRSSASVTPSGVKRQDVALSQHRVGRRTAPSGATPGCSCRRPASTECRETATTVEHPERHAACHQPLEFAVCSPQKWRRLSGVHVTERSVRVGIEADEEGDEPRRGRVAHEMQTAMLPQGVLAAGVLDADGRTRQANTGRR